MTDIVERLRLRDEYEVMLDHLNQPYGLAKSLEHEAADEIERLRTDRDVWRNESIKKQAACEQMGVRVGALEAERDKLRKEVREAFCEGFYEGKDGGWVVGPEGTPWKESHACAALKGINDD
jgi:hypothetical protein